ncbi:MAG TPA: BatA domain-containing protein, partial [Vicinamibacterales bacterium]
MTFLAPAFLFGAAIAAVPLILHLLKREPEPRVKFAAVKLLKNAPVEHSQRHRLRELLLLALRVGALVLLALEAVDRAPAGDRIGVVTFADEADLAAK